MTQEARPKRSTARVYQNPLDGRERACYAVAMKRLAALALAACALAGAPRAARADAAPARAELPAGRYSIQVKGLLCAVCARAIAAEWAKLPAVEKVEMDFDAGSAVVTVRIGKTLSVAALRKSFRRAERVANLGARYDLGDIAYLP
jgi:copper chaperone CopZ